MGTAIIYATGLTKHTKVLADYMAKRLNADIFNLKEITRINVTDFDTVIFGTPVSGGKADKRVVEFVENNKSALDGKRLMVFIDGKNDGDKMDAQCAIIKEQLGIDDVTYINAGKGCEMNDSGIPVAVDSFLARV